MSINHLLSDMLTRIRNGQMASLSVVRAPHSKFLEQCLRVLCTEGYLRGFEKKEDSNNKPILEIQLKYFDGVPVIKTIKTVSKPGRRVTTPITDLGKCKNGLGVVVLTTSKGVMADHEARKANVGGEVLFEVF